MGSIFSTPSPPPKPVPEIVKGQTPVPLVLCYSYIGTGYHGLQKNKDQKTIEGDLFKALVDSYLVRPGSLSNLSSICWNQASRTDCGVHSCAQVLTFKAQFPVGVKTRDVPRMINENLPKGSTIVVWKAIDVGNKFQAQRFAEYRKYLYLMPLYVLGDKPDLDHIRKNILSKFIGEKNYHNYTRGVSATNPSAKRTITNFDVSEPFDLCGEKYVLWTIRGKSFMINQIRKMLATVLSCVYGKLSLEELEMTFSTTKWALPRLPGDGLMLDRVEYPGFMKNSVRSEQFTNPNKDVEFEIIRPQIEEWKNKVLFPHIAKYVKDNDIFRKWIYDVLLIYPPVPQNEMDEANQLKRQKEL